MKLLLSENALYQSLVSPREESLIILDNEIELSEWILYKAYMDCWW